MNQPWLIILVAAAGVTIAKVLPALLPAVGDGGRMGSLMRYLPAAILGAVTASGIASLASGSASPWALYLALAVVAAVAAWVRRTWAALALGLILMVAVYAARLV
jgi:branched-subunit amino acid transport protein AzlD